MNKLSHQSAKHFRDVFFGGNWTTRNLRDVLDDVTWEEAIMPIHPFNTIVTLTHHVTYYIPVLTDVLEGKPLTGNDKLSFSHPKIESETDWKELQTAAWNHVEKAASLIEQLSDEQLNSVFTDEKFGTYFRNIHGIIEHTHYHLGQIVILKQLIRKESIT